MGEWAMDIMVGELVAEGGGLCYYKKEQMFPWSIAINK